MAALLNFGGNLELMSMRGEADLLMGVGAT